MRIHDDEVVDNLNLKGYHIIQKKKAFKFGIDAVILSEFARVNQGENVLDMGTGTGIIPILLKGKTLGHSFYGLEIQSEFVEMAKRSADMNQISNEVIFVEGDIKEADSLFPLSSFDVITSNPPYMNEGNGLVNPESAKAIARHEILCTLEDVIAQSSRILKVGGRLYMVHRPKRLVEIFEVMRKYKMEPKTLRMVHSFIDSEGTMVLIEAVRYGKPLLNVREPLIIYKDKGVYTDEVRRYYKPDEEIKL